MPDRETFLITLEALPDEVPAARRLAQALKHLLRAHRLRCVKAVEVKQAEPAAAGDGGKQDAR